MKKIIALMLVVVLALTAAVSGTMAYLKDTDADVNVMTLGNVAIKQIEQERDANGDLQNFTQAKPAYPVVGDITWDNEGVDVNGTEYKVYDDALKNVIDKIVTVQNTGKSDAYVRTIVAIEAPDYDPNNLIHVNFSPEGLTKTNWAPVTIDEVDYVYSVFTYNAALAPEEISTPSLMQVFLDSSVDNEDVEKFGETWEILVLSQAVQAQGFANAGTALDTAFGAATAEKTAQWLAPLSGKKLAESTESLNQGGEVIVAGDIAVDNDGLTLTEDAVINLNGQTISSDNDYVSGTVVEKVSTMVVRGADVTLEGNGTVVNNAPEGAYALAIYEGATVTIKDGTFISYYDAIYVREGTLIIEGGFFDATEDNDPAPDSHGCHVSSAINCNDDVYAAGAAVVVVKGGTFVNMDPSSVHEGKLHNQSFVADGYKVVAQPQSNGDVWYTVVPA